MDITQKRVSQKQACPSQTSSNEMSSSQACQNQENTIPKSPVQKKSVQDWLVADIGGTHCRFAHFRYHPEAHKKNMLVLSGYLHLATKDFLSLQELLENVFQQWSFPFHACALAVPGVVYNERVAILPNVSWNIDLDILSCAQLPKKTWLLNDFIAQGWACLLPEAQQHLPIHTPNTLPNNTVSASSTTTFAVIGAGTGLGYCSVRFMAGTWHVLPSEGGHAPFPLYPEESDYGHFLRKKDLPIIGDTVLTGKGLTLLHEYYTGEILTPANVVKHLEHTPVGEHFARLYGRATQALALQTLAFDGIFITGGVAMSTPSLVQHPAFLDAFMENSKEYQNVLQRIPVSLVTNSQVALWGAARFLQERNNDRFS